MMIGDFKRCWDEEIATLNTMGRYPFKPYRNSPLHVDHGEFLNGPSKLTLQFDQTDSAEDRCQSIISNAKQVGSVTRSGKEKFKLAITSNFQQPQQFQVGYKEYSRHTKRSVKVKAVVELQLCINLDTAEVSGIFSYSGALFTTPCTLYT
jgi:hypothetical protein